MDQFENPGISCRTHGQALQRAKCAECNAAYMRAYQRRKRLSKPKLALLERARERARARGLQFSLKPSDISIPVLCPAIAIPITFGRRAPGSASLDRINPHQGYVAGNVRVISDSANRLKSLHSLETLRQLGTGSFLHREEYQKIAKYVERETLLAKVRERSGREGRAGEEWKKVSEFLDRAFREGSLLNVPPVTKG